MLVVDAVESNVNITFSEMFGHMIRCEAPIIITLKMYRKFICMYFIPSFLVNAMILIYVRGNVVMLMFLSLESELFRAVPNGFVGPCFLQDVV